MIDRPEFRGPILVEPMPGMRWLFAVLFVSLLLWHHCFLFDKNMAMQKSFVFGRSTRDHRSILIDTERYRLGTTPAKSPAVYKDLSSFAVMSGQAAALYKQQESYIIQ